MHYQKPLQKHIVLFCVLVLSCLTVIFIFNFLIDPYQLYGNPLHVKKRPGDLKNKSHLIKAIQIMREKPDIMVLGSSTVDCGFALPGSTSNFDYPDYRSSQRKMLEVLHRLDPALSLGTTPVFNAGINGATLRDIYEIFQHAYENNPQLKQVILGLEWHLFTDEMPPTRFGPDVPALHQTHMPLQTLINTTLTLTSLHDSFRTMHLNFKMLRNLVKIYEKCSRFITSIRRFYIYAPANSSLKLVEEPMPIYFKPLTEQVITGQKGSETTALLLSIYYLSTLLHYYEAKGETAVLNPKAFDYLQKIVKFAHDKNIKLDVYITPQHGTHWATADRFGLGNYVDVWLRKIADITPFWDFSGRIDFHDNVSDYFGGDDRHFKYNVGEVILPVILAGKADTKNGITLANRANIEQLIKQRHRYQKQWLQHNPYLAAIFNNQHFKELRHQKADMQRLLVQFQPSYQKYTIIRFLGNVVALPSQQAPYDIGRLIRQEYANMVQADSALGVQLKIAQQRA